MKENASTDRVHCSLHRQRASVIEPMLASEQSCRWLQPGLLDLHLLRIKGVRARTWCPMSPIQ
jgi:hypothetical protein